MIRSIKLTILAILIFSFLTMPLRSLAAVESEWVKRSNDNAQLLLAVQAKFSPESAGRTGIDGLDEEIVDLKPGVNERTKTATLSVIKTLKERLAGEQDKQVREDLEILINAATQNIRNSDLSEKYEIPFINMPRLVFGGIRTLLDDQIPASRRPAALVRLRRYAGQESGYQPLCQLAEARIKEKLNQPGLIAPIKAELDRALAESAFFIDGIGKLFEKYHLEGYQENYAKLKVQLTAYNEFVKKELLPKARSDFRQPAELYAAALEEVGVDIPPAELAAKAHAAFDQLQKEMQVLAAQVAKERKLNVTDYRDVIRALKKEQLVGEAILPFYEQRIKEIEAIIEREHLVTLPKRPMRIRLASEAESAAMPAPNMRPPRMIGNTGEMGEFVLPLSFPGAEGNAKLDDFTYAASSWTLTAHEGRPGHELQFAAMIERGISTARVLFAFNSVNVEGWGLYSEAILKPYMPAEGQLISLQARLLRAARAFLDPELQLGKVTPEQAFKVLTDDVVTSEAMANSEVERYTFRIPGQATSYFYGYLRLIELRADTEKALGAKFDQQKFHDFILSQGLLPPALMRKAVFAEFINQK